jgi:hypothetical protein
MKITKLETRKSWLCEINGTTYVRTEIEWTDDKPNTITWHLNEDQVSGKVSLNLHHNDEDLERLFWENKTKSNTTPLVNIPKGDDFFKEGKYTTELPNGDDFLNK